MSDPVSPTLSCLAFYLPLLLILPLAWVIRYTSGKVHETFEDPSDIIQEVRLRSRMQKWFLVFAIAIIALFALVIEGPNILARSTVGQGFTSVGICVLLPGLGIILYCASDLLRCPRCRQKLESSPDLKFCPNCGAQFTLEDTE
ncbi:MAG: hypothetical protein AB1894_05510 [Chloroflexota bacterium]